MYQKTILKNGVSLITAPLKETSTATLLVLFKVGSRNETGKINGVSHFLEHMMFKGTKKRPNALSLTKELDGVGAEFNAFTGKDYTGYFVKADARHLDLAIDVLSDMLINSKLDAKEVEREKGVIVEEINMYEDTPIRYVEDMLEELMFSGDPLGRLIAGSRETVRGLSRSDLAAYKQKFYFGKNTVIGLAGRFENRHISAIKAKFKLAPGKTRAKIVPIKIKQNQPQVKVRFKETEQIQVAIGFPGYAYGHPKLNALQLLSVILGGNMSSRLFLKVRERNGLAYFVRSWLNVYEDTGGLIVQSGLDKMRIDKAIVLILSELKRIKNGVTAVELKRAKEYLAGKVAIDLEDSSHLAQWYVQQDLLTGKILTPEEKVKKVMAIPLSDVAKAAKEVIDFSRLNLTIIGPYQDEKKFIDLIKKSGV